MKYILLIIFISIHFNASSQDDLTIHRWENRILLIIVNDHKDELLYNQLEILKDDQDGLSDRDLLVYQITPDSFSKGLEKDTVWKESNSLFNRYSGRKGPFEVILIGLDGGVKLRKSEVITSQELFGIIDRMPMRQAEIKKKKKKGA